MTLTRVPDAARTSGPTSASWVAIETLRPHLTARRILILAIILTFCGLFWWAVGAMLLHTVDFVGHRSTRVVEPLPPQYASGPSQTGRTREVIYDDLHALQRFCFDQGAPYGPPRRRGDRYVMACYSPPLDIVALPSRKAWPSANEIAELRRHEWAHARGWRHNADGTGTSVSSLPPQAAGPR